MSSRETQKYVARDVLVEAPAHNDVPISPAPLCLETTHSVESRQLHTLASKPEYPFRESPGTSLLSRRQTDPNLSQVLQSSQISGQAPRIAFKAKGKILFLSISRIVVVQAEGNYVSLRHSSRPYLLHESLSSMAEKLKPFGFIRIHRSVLVNISAVEEIQPLASGEYKLRVRGGEDYLVTRTYKKNLRDLAQVWIGSECLGVNQHPERLGS